MQAALATVEGLGTGHPPPGSSDVRGIRLNIRRSRSGKPPFEVTIHASKANAVDEVTDEIKEDRCLRDHPLHRAGTGWSCAALRAGPGARDEVEQRRIERERAAIEGRMLRWRQWGL